MKDRAVDLRFIERAKRLLTLGFLVKSEELAEDARAADEFFARGGNRELRRRALFLRGVERPKTANEWRARARRIGRRRRLNAIGRRSRAVNRRG